MTWRPGEVIVRREVLNDGRPWLGTPVRVVEDTPHHLVTYIAEGARFGFPAGDFPTPDGRHPWQARTGWTRSHRHPGGSAPTAPDPAWFRPPPGPVR